MATKGRLLLLAVMVAAAAVMCHSVVRADEVVADDQQQQQQQEEFVIGGGGADHEIPTNEPASDHDYMDDLLVAEEVHHSQNWLNMSSRVLLNNGKSIPRMGFGVYTVAPGDDTYWNVKKAIIHGFRHFDTARRYGNEADVGRAIRDSGYERSEFFVTTKLWIDDAGYEETLKAVDDSNVLLGLRYIDMYLIHAPVEGKRLDSWRAMEMAYQLGWVRSIGVSNYGKHHLEELLAVAQVTPAVNQVELSPFNTRTELVTYCESKGIAVEAYSPLTKGQRLNDTRLVELAGAYNKTTAQVLLRWGLQNNFIVLPGTQNIDHIREDSEIFDFALSDADMAVLNSMDEGLVTGWDPTKWN